MPRRRRAHPPNFAKLICTGLALALLAACAPLPPRNPMATWVPSRNYDIRAPQLIVLHFTDQDSVAQSLHTLRTANSGGPVSAHYLVGRDGHIYQLVSDVDRAWHAGGGRWGTITDVNSASIGIEIDNNGHVPFPPEQIASLINLLTDLTARWDIPRAQIIGHEDMAPTRKDDPGPLFPWAALAAAGFGLWPDPPATLVDPAPGFDPWMALTAIGYSLDDPAAAVRAFHDHFRGMRGDTLDAEDLRILYNLVGKIERGATGRGIRLGPAPDQQCVISGGFGQCGMLLAGRTGLLVGGHHRRLNAKRIRACCSLEWARRGAGADQETGAAAAIRQKPRAFISTSQSRTEEKAWQCRPLYPPGC